MSSSNELLDLRQELLQTTDPDRRREILARVLAQIEVGWSNLFEELANEQNPERILLMLAELDAIVESRKTQLTEKAARARA